MFGPDGRLIADDLLGIRQIDGYAPTQVMMIRIKGENVPKLNVWFDIAPDSFNFPNFGGYKSCDGQFTSAIKQVFVHPNAAIEHATATALAECGKSARLVNAGDLPSAPQPLPGVERWYVVRG